MQMYQETREKVAPLQVSGTEQQEAVFEQILASLPTPKVMICDPHAEMKQPKYASTRNEV